MEITPKLGGIGKTSAGIISHGLIGEEGAEHRTDTRRIHRHSGALGSILHTVAELASPSLQALIHVWLTQQPQRLDPRRHRQWIPRQRARLINRPQRRDLFHDITPPAKGPYRQPTADDFPQNGEVRGDAVEVLRPAIQYPKAGDHLVEH